ncbi:choline/ethanolamine kinase-like protein [Cryptosporidium canis]|uniref:ethanolamine kinase n=1 Tax=Cryptosporidium canis TaxID=195482 RepID=A0A9D5HYB9_9CRYT|nr:choline/ethanolamine kinase-like protein [Cryptosporidium canis]
MTDYGDLSKSKLKEAEKVCWELLNTGICECCLPDKLVRSKILTGGLSNILVLVSISMDLFCEKMKKINKNIITPNLKVRFYSKERKIFVNEKREQLIQNLLSKAGMIKPILHYFKGGQVEEFVEGKTLEVEDLRNRLVYISIAEKIASLHSINISEDILENIYLEFNTKYFQGIKCVPLPDSKAQPISILWPTLDKWLSLSEKILSQTPNECLIDFGKLKILISRLQRSLYSDSLSNLTCSIVVSHSDLLPGNIIETLSKNYIFIDYEFSGTMECVFDIGNHLCEWAGFECNWDYLPNDETIFEFIKYYIAGLSINRSGEKGFECNKTASNTSNINNLKLELGELENNCQCSNHITKENLKYNENELTTITAYVKATKICMVISNIFWGLWGICKSDPSLNDSSSSMFDYKSYGYRKLESINAQPYFRNIIKGVDPDFEFPAF